jgi:hypothetical protein
MSEENTGENAGDEVAGDKIVNEGGESTDQATGSDGPPESPADGEQPADAPADGGEEGSSE